MKAEDPIYLDIDAEPEADFSAIRILYFILIAAAGFALIFGAVCVLFILRGGL